MKATRRESLPCMAAETIPSSSNSTLRGRTSSDGEDRGGDPSTHLPPAFRSIVRSTSLEKKLKRSGKRVVNRLSGTSAVSKIRESSQERRSRKSSIEESFAKHALPGRSSHSKGWTGGTRSEDLLHETDPLDSGDNLTAGPPSEQDYDSASDDKSIDLASIGRMVKTVSKMHENKNNRSFSDRGYESSGDLNRSLDLSSHNNKLLNKSGDINTSASDDQWARFKLLGRIGLGEIEPGGAARAFIKQNVKVLLPIIKKVMALRDSNDGVDITERMHRSLDFRTGYLLEEVKETVEIKKTRAMFKRDPASIQLHHKVVEQLEDYVTVIAKLYRDNPFHNFEHASTVLSAVNKVVSLAVAPDEIDYTDIRFITTDPWTHFALAYSALIHDVDHSGVPNAQLIKEKAHVAVAYKNKSVAEQNSLELSWNLLMEPCYRELREALFINSSELMHFRSLVVTATLATDIADKELAAMRKDRAADALAVLDAEPTSDDVASRKATFVLETLIQVADVSHLMMPFPFYKKWNYKLLRETHGAFVDGRAEKDPLESWYNGEFGFFDFYIIPLAKKLDKIGIDSTPYLNNAINNRKQWEEVGEELVEGFKNQLRMEKASIVSSASPTASSSDDSSVSLGSSSESSVDTDFDGFTDEKKESHGSVPLRTPQKTPLSAKARILAIQREKAAVYSDKLRSSNIKTRSSVGKGSIASGSSERGERSIHQRQPMTSGSERGGRTIRRIAYVSKAAAPAGPGTTEQIVQDKKVRSRTPVPPGEQRFFQKSKSCSTEMKEEPATNSDGDEKSRRKKPMRRKLRSQSLDSSRSDHTSQSKKGKRPGTKTRE
jgi:3'5'-cyclic nucleotide phosphodiesterase